MTGRTTIRAISRRIVAFSFAAGLAAFAVAGSASAAPARMTGHVSTISVQAGPRSARPDAAASGSPKCFKSAADCVSGSPDAALGFHSNGDTTGCTFDLEITWGDGKTTSDTVDGQADGTPYGPYDHTYAAAGLFPVNWSVTVESDTGANNCVNSSGANSFTYFPCPQQGQAAPVTLPAAESSAGTVKNVYLHISYGKLPLTFTSRGPAGNSVCTVVSNVGSLPVKLFGQTIGYSTATATVEFLPANDASTQVHACNFAGLQGLANVNATPSAGAVNGANNCLLTSSGHDPTGVIARWSTPGFTVAGIPETGPLTFYLDLSALGGSAWSTASFAETLQDVEEYTHLTLVNNLSLIDKMVAFIDPPANLSVTDPQGQTVGVIGRGKTTSFAGSGYFRAGKDSVAWILVPSPGSYSVTASGAAGEGFTTDEVVMQFLGHGTHPLTGITTWKGKLGRHGTAQRDLSVKGSSLTPRIVTHESKTRAKIKAAIRFSLTGSAIPYGPPVIVWSFGDGTTAKGLSASHAYSKRGRYTPSVTITNRIGKVVTVKLPAITITG